MDASFSMDLSEEVVHVRDWVHEFAESVIRPAAAEWDEREETPWPIIQEAAKVGLYTPDLFGQMAAADVRHPGRPEAGRVLLVGARRRF
jgi:acyl-CoA dehydrogenase